MSRRTSLLAAVALLLAALAVGARSGESGRAAARTAILLPDLVQTPPRMLRLERAGERWRLGFLSAAVNRGRGALVVRGRRASTSDPDMTARQLLRRRDGTLVRGPRVGTLRYVTSSDHSHWHLRRFMRYELRTTGGRLVAPGRKVGFCLTDSSRDTGDGRLPGERERPRFTERCGLGRPNALKVTEGISVGWRDVYTPMLEGQFVDLTGVRAGRYVLVHRVNAGGPIRERTRSNNAASLLVRIRRPNGRAGRPRVSTLARCFHSARCTAKSR